MKKLYEEILNEYNEEYGAIGVDFVKEALARQLDEIVKIIENSKPDERKVKVYKNYNAGTYYKKMLVREALDDIINKLKIN